MRGLALIWLLDGHSPTHAAPMSWLTRKSVFDQFSATSYKTKNVVRSHQGLLNKVCVVGGERKRGREERGGASEARRSQ